MLEERTLLAFGYQAPIAGSIIAGPIAAGSPLNETDFSQGSWFGWDPIVPMIIVGTNPDNVLNGTETGALSPSVITITGTRFGAPLVRTINVSAKGAYSAARAFDTLASITSNVDVGAVVNVAVGKGLGTRNPIDTGESYRVSLDGAIADTPSTIDGPTGTVIPSGAYNPGESTAVVRYTPLLA